MRRRGALRVLRRPGIEFLVNVPAAIALERAVLAHLRGDGENTALYASRALAAPGKGERMLESLARWYLGVAEWLCGRLPEAERAFASSIARSAAIARGSRPLLALRACGWSAVVAGVSLADQHDFLRWVEGRDFGPPALVAEGRSSTKAYRRSRPFDGTETRGCDLRHTVPGARHEYLGCQKALARGT